MRRANEVTLVEHAQSWVNDRLNRWVFGFNRLPESGNLFWRTFTDSTLFVIAHTLLSPEGTFSLHVDFVVVEEWSFHEL